MKPGLEVTTFLLLPIVQTGFGAQAQSIGTDLQCPENLLVSGIYWKESLKTESMTQRAWVRRWDIANSFRMDLNNRKEVAYV